jgi:hypothetical protein
MRLAPRESLRFCGRTFQAHELEWMKSLLACESLTRCQLARRVCEQWHWVNRAGRLKEMSCRVALLRMERAGLIRLPAPRQPNTNGRPSPDELRIPRPEVPLTFQVTALLTIVIGVFVSVLIRQLVRVERDQIPALWLGAGDG